MIEDRIFYRETDRKHYIVKCFNNKFDHNRSLMGLLNDDRMVNVIYNGIYNSLDFYTNVDKRCDMFGCAYKLNIREYAKDYPYLIVLREKKI